MIERMLRKLNQKIGYSIYQAALADLQEGRAARGRPSVLEVILSLCILAIPFVCVAIGSVLIWFDFPNLLTIVFGGAFLGLAWTLRPRARPVPEPSFGREDLPEVFGLLDALSTHLNAPKVDRLCLNSDFNAFATLARGKAVLGIGSAFWLALGPEQRLALLSHELGHLVNRDAEKSALGARALDVMEGLLFISADEVYFDQNSHRVERVSNGLVADIIHGIFQFFLDLVYTALLKLRFHGSQKAEYLADAVSVRGAGVRATVELMDILVMVGASDAARGVIMPQRGETGLAFTQRLADSVHAVPEDRRRRALEMHEDELLALDGSHPPTKYRKAFVRELPAESVGVPFAFSRWDAVERELAPRFDDIGEDLMDQFRLQ